MVFRIFSFTLVIVMAILGYSEERIPECILNYKFGPEQHILVVEKSSHTLYIYSNYKSSPLEKIKITTGKIPGRKMFEGDMKTPEGIYFFTRILSGRELPTVDDYGDKAFIMNYPNPVDRRDHRNGSGIWLHGAHNPDKTSHPNNSRGCVVMSNKDLIRVSKYIFLNHTPICIYHKIIYTNPNDLKRRRDELIKNIRQWKTNWENKNLDKYIDQYSHDYIYNNMNLTSFKRYKKRLNKLYQFIRVFLSKVNVYSYKNYYVSMFNQLYISNQNNFYSRKIQYWESDNKNRYRIMAEQSVRLPAISKFEITKGNYINIDEYRKDCLTNLKVTKIDYAPRGIFLRNISVLKNEVKLSLRLSSSGKSMGVIPVLLLKNREETKYKTMDNITLKNGLPQDYSQSIAVYSDKASIVISKDSDFNVRSLTLFAINEKNELEQVVTYFVKK